MSGDTGLLPLLDALKESATLGSIKLLYRSLSEQSGGRLNVCDAQGNFPLHPACRGGNCGVVKYLLEKQTVGVSKRFSCCCSRQRAVVVL